MAVNATSEDREGRVHVLQVLASKTHCDVAVQEELLVDIKEREFLVPSSPRGLLPLLSMGCDWCARGHVLDHH